MMLATAEEVGDECRGGLGVPGENCAIEGEAVSTACTKSGSRSSDRACEMFAGTLDVWGGPAAPFCWPTGACCLGLFCVSLAMPAASFEGLSERSWKWQVWALRCC